MPKIEPSTIEFLWNLSLNNNKEWFHGHKTEYEFAKKNFQNFCNELLSEVVKIDPLVAKSKEKALKFFRINRDIRFSKDKSPYKNNLGCVITPFGDGSGYGLYYIHVEPENSGIAGGMYMIEPELLLKVRKLISNKFTDFKKIIDEPEFKEYFGAMEQEDKLKTAPKGFEKDDPAIEYLKFKHFTVWKGFTNKQVIGDDFFDSAVDGFKKIKKLNDFLNKAIQ